MLVVNGRTEILGYTAGNDVSSRDIEGENSLYLPQAKIYDGSCSLGPGIVLGGPDSMRDLLIRMRIVRDGEAVYEDEVSTSRMKRPSRSSPNTSVGNSPSQPAPSPPRGPASCPTRSSRLHRGIASRSRSGSLFSRTPWLDRRTLHKRHAPESAPRPRRCGKA